MTTPDKKINDIGSDTHRFFAKVPAGPMDRQSVMDESCCGHQNAGLIAMAKGFIESWGRSDNTRRREVLDILRLNCGASNKSLQEFLSYGYNYADEPVFHRAAVLAFLGHHPVAVAESLNWGLPVMERFAVEDQDLDVLRSLLDD